MKYVTSNNLKKNLKLKNSIYRFIPEEDDLDIDSYFCGECRKIFEAPKVVKPGSIVCPKCGFKSKILYSYFYGEYNVDAILDGVTINKSFNDDGNVRDINITMLRRSYKIQADLQKQISWQYYNRVLFNFETKQAYYTNKQLLSKKVEFSHFLLHKEVATESSEFSPVIPRIIQEIYNEYGIKPETGVNTWYNATPKNMRSSVIAFMCLKFPILMNFAYDLWTSYKCRTNQYGSIDVQITIVYWVCNYDRTLKAALTAITEETYIERTDAILGKMTNDVALIKSVRYNPLYVIYARYMYCLGFREFDSVERIVSLMSQPDIHKLKIGIFVIDLLRKREHVRNKMYKRLLKVYTEQQLLDIICDSRVKCTYREFFNWSHYAVSINDMYRILEQQMQNNCPVQEVYDSLIDVCN